MAKRLQVILKDHEYSEIQRAARSRHLSIAEWVRQILAHACRHESRGEVERKLAAVRAAARYESPTSDLDTMLSEIEQGYAYKQP